MTFNEGICKKTQLMVKRYTMPTIKPGKTKTTERNLAIKKKGKQRRGPHLIFGKIFHLLVFSLSVK
jgi:hypothetical protein